MSNRPDPERGPAYSLIPIVLELRDDSRDRALATDVYVPRVGSDWPLIVFGHGAWGSRFVVAARSTIRGQAEWPSLEPFVARYESGMSRDGHASAAFGLGRQPPSPEGRY